MVWNKVVGYIEGDPSFLSVVIIKHTHQEQLGEAKCLFGLYLLVSVTLGDTKTGTCRQEPQKTLLTSLSSISCLTSFLM